MKNTPQPHTGRILDLRQTQAVVQDIASGRHWGLPYAAVLAEPTTAAQQPPHASPPPPPQAKRWDQLNKALAEPSLYDDVLSYLNRNGFGMPVAVLDRDFSVPYEPSKAVEKVWRDIYADQNGNLELQDLGETLADIAEGFSTWKYLHLMATRRTFGGRPAYFGTEGVAWLVPTMDKIPFPELWSARGFIGDPPAACPHMHK